MSDDVEPEDANLVEDFDDEDDEDDHDDANLKVTGDAGGVVDEPQRVTADTAVSVLEYLVKAVVEEPDGVEVDVFDRRGRASLEVHVAQGDMGRVIGKRGRVAQSIRTVVRAAAVRDGVEVDVEFVE
ncbi:MAG: uncharacterized protein QOH64_2827 [Acidimicrobiaceae bacterium]